MTEDPAKLGLDALAKLAEGGLAELTWSRDLQLKRSSSEPLRLESEDNKHQNLDVSETLGV